MPQLTHYGRILWNDYSPAAGVRVRVLDRDTSGTDDDMTVTEGMSDGNGYFSVAYDTDRFQDFIISRWETNEFVCDEYTDPLTGIKVPTNCRWEKRRHEERLPDPTDVFAPYFRLSYTVNNEAKAGTYAILPAPIRLPETRANPPGAFRPSVDGFRFVNRFTGAVALPFPVSGVQTISESYGLCGGMCAAALDFWRDPIQSTPTRATAPPNGSALHQYLVQRQIDSFGPNGEAAARFPVWMELQDNGSNGIRRRTRDEFSILRNMLAQGAGAVPLGLVYMAPGALQANPANVFKNHQVLAVGVRGTLSDPEVTISIYDPNFPNEDNAVIRCRQVVVAILQPPTPIPLPGLPSLPPPPPILIMGLQCTQSPAPSISGFPGANVRGFFVMPYAPKVPPPGL